MRIQGFLRHNTKKYFSEASKSITVNDKTICLILYKKIPIGTQNSFTLIPQRHP